MNMTNNTVLVTGGGSGIGLALARAFLRLGNAVIICGRDRAKLDRARADNADLVAITCDITDEGGQHALVDTLARDFPGLNVLLNNAGVQYAYDFSSGDDRSHLVEKEVATNFTAPVKLTDRLLPHLMRQPHAAVVNVSSSLAIVPKESAPVYCATKAAIHIFTKALRYQLEKTSVKVFEIIPALVDTEMTRGRGKGKITADALATEAIAGMKADRYEIRIERAKLLFALHRILPALSERAIRKS